MSRRLFLDFHDKNRTGKKYQRLFPLPHIWYTCSMKKLCGRCHPHFTQLSIPWINFLLKLNCDRLENSKFALMPVFASQYHGIPLHLWGTLKFSNIFTNKRLYFSQLSKLLGLSSSFCFGTDKLTYIQGLSSRAAAWIWRQAGQGKGRRDGNQGWEWEGTSGWTQCLDIGIRAWAWKCRWEWSPGDT